MSQLRAASPIRAVGLLAVLLVPGCGRRPEPAEVPKAQYSLTAEKTHSRFSRTIPPVLRVPSGAVVALETREVTADQLKPSSTAAELRTLNFDPIHPLTGPIYVEGAAAGDVLAVTVHQVELKDWGWVAAIPGFGFLADEFKEPFLKIFRFGPGDTVARFNDKIMIPLRPFAGVMGVAPSTDSMLVTIPPRANGGNMDNRYLGAGSKVYFPVFVEGALFSVGDAHAAQGDGEVGGTGIEAPVRMVVELQLLKGGRKISEPQYETDDFYAVGAHGTTLEQAAKNATRYMIDYLVAEHGLSRAEAYVLCSVAADLRVTEVVDVPHVWVAMHIPKRVLGMTPQR
jgi:acetamidase/formamidase